MPEDVFIRCSQCKQLHIKGNKHKCLNFVPCMPYTEALQMKEKKESSLPKLKSSSPVRYTKRQLSISKTQETDINNDPEISFGQYSQNLIQTPNLPTLSNPPSLTSRSKTPVTIRRQLAFITPSKIRESSRKDLILKDVTPLRNRKLIRVDTADFNSELLIHKDIKNTENELKSGVYGERIKKVAKHAHCFKHANFFAVTYCNRCGVDLCVKCSSEHEEHDSLFKNTKILLKAPSVTDIDPFKNTGSVALNLVGFSRIDEENENITPRKIKICSDCGYAVNCPDIHSKKEYDLWKICYKCQNKTFTTTLSHTETEAIIFKDDLSDFYEFSLSAPIPVMINDRRWESTKEYINAQKNSSKWEDAKDEIIEKVCEEKFKQHPRLYQLLMSTSGRELMFCDSNEKYWGIGFNGLGKNRLGETLMKIRDGNIF
ncbi:unnamed protein product [Blepharisma stoltei]|uniref:B box-type domain-containing protein n=1 Tax=Blepharisma stoltei TaxID=1481888 RepID=A0AAU9I7X8_9CILI|nr:unnamed protein product [Blepharisma stoltei]